MRRKESGAQSNFGQVNDGEEDEDPIDDGELLRQALYEEDKQVVDHALK